MENPMLFREEIELHYIHECNSCGEELEDEEEVYDDGTEELCKECLCNKYRLTA
jgi:formylmethanofuran dehydrogenase subunit E